MQAEHLCCRVRCKHLWHPWLRPHNFTHSRPRTGNVTLCMFVVHCMSHVAAVRHDLGDLLRSLCTHHAFRACIFTDQLKCRHTAQCLRSLRVPRKFKRRVRTYRRRHRHRQMTTGGVPLIYSTTCVPRHIATKQQLVRPSTGTLAPSGRCPLQAGVHPLRYVDVDSAQQKAPAFVCKPRSGWTLPDPQLAGSAMSAACSTAVLAQGVDAL